MGIPRGTARLLLDEHRRRPFSGSVLELGRMSVYLTPAELGRWAAVHGVALAPVESLGRSHDPRLAALGCLDDRTFFRLLGFSEVVSCDYSPWEGADLHLDLNRPVPEALHGRFDVVFESGTLQYLFDIPAALRNVWALLKPGGRVVHGMLPSHNHVDHGFYMFCPTLFHDFYSANRWRLETELFFEFEPYWYRSKFLSAPWKIRRYTPGCLDHLSYGGFGAAQVGLFVVATKTAEATGEGVPQQGYYQRFWAEKAAARMDAGAQERRGARPGAAAAAERLAGRSAPSASSSAGSGCGGRCAERWRAFSGAACRRWWRATESSPPAPGERTPRRRGRSGATAGRAPRAPRPG
jgi:SAM-dependent methyltransferase